MQSDKDRLRELCIELVEDHQDDNRTIEIVKSISNYIHRIGDHTTDELLDQLFIYSCLMKVDTSKIYEIERLSLLLGDINDNESDSDSCYSYNEQCSYCPYEYDAVVPLDQPREVKSIPYSRELEQRGMRNEITILPRYMDSNDRWVIEPSIDSYMIDVINMHVHPGITREDMIEVVNNVIARALARENHTTSPPPIVLDNIDLTTKREVIIKLTNSITDSDNYIVRDGAYSLIVEPPIVGIPLDIIHDIRPSNRENIEVHISQLLEKYSKKRDEYREYKSKLSD